jgi:hypothetical protein
MGSVAYLFQNYLTGKLFCYIWEFPEKAIFVNTVFQIKNFHELDGLYQLVLEKL